MKTLIMGNGSSVREHKLGNKIDSYDVVIRFNRGYFEGIKGYEEYVGSKTDILIIHDGFAKPEYITDNVFNFGLGYERFFNVGSLNFNMGLKRMQSFDGFSYGIEYKTNGKADLCISLANVTTAWNDDYTVISFKYSYGK